MLKYVFCFFLDIIVVGITLSKIHHFPNSVDNILYFTTVPETRRNATRLPDYQISTDLRAWYFSGPASINQNNIDLILKLIKFLIFIIIIMSEQIV